MARSVTGVGESLAVGPGTTLDPQPHEALGNEPRPPSRRRILLHRWFTPQFWIIAPIVLIVGYLTLVPLIYLLWRTVHDGTSFTTAFLASAFSHAGLLSLLGNSIVFAVGSTIVPLILGTTLAYLTVRTDVPMRGFFFAVALIPLLIPGVLLTIAWILLASPEIGVINRALQPIFGRPILDVFTMPGMILVESLGRVPLVFLLMYAGFRSMDPALEESAVVSGARLTTVLRRISLPLMRPALIASVLVLMVRALESFEVPALLGMNNGIYVLTSRIWRVLQGFPPDYGQAGALSLMLLVLTSVGIYWQSRMTKRARSFQTVTGKGFRPHRIELRGWRLPAVSVAWLYFLLTVFAPLAILVWASLRPFYTVPNWSTLFDFDLYTLANYERVLDSRIVVRATRNSLILAMGTATTVMFSMAVLSWLVIRTKIPGRWVIDNLTFLPMAIPGLVLGVSLLFVYLRFPLPIYGTLWILYIAYFTQYMPYGMRYASTSMYQIAAELEESADTSGASWWQTFRRITLPLLVPGLLTGWVFIALVSMRTISNSILLYSPGTQVLGILIWEQWQDGRLTQLAALGVLLVIALSLIVFVAQKLGARFGVQESGT